MFGKKRGRKSKTVRIGANRQRFIDEQRTHRDSASAGVLRRVLRVAVVVVVAAAAGIAVFRYSPAVYMHASDAIQSSKRLYANVKITHCSRPVQAALKNALDSLIHADSFSFDRVGAVQAASLIPEIEKISIKKMRDRKSREQITLVKVTERKPVALVHSGEICLVDKKGVRFAAVPGQYYDLPLLVVNGTAYGDTLDLDVFNSIKKMCRNMGGSFFQQISQIDVSDSGSVNLIFKSGEAEYLISPDDMEEKLVQIKRLRERLLEEESEPARIDMRYRRLAYTSVQ